MLTLQHWSLHCPLASQFYLLIPTQALLSSYSSPYTPPLPCITSLEPLKSGFCIRSIRCHCTQLIPSDTLPCPLRYFLCFVLTPLCFGFCGYALSSSVIVLALHSLVIYLLRWIEPSWRLKVIYPFDNFILNCFSHQ